MQKTGQFRPPTQKSSQSIPTQKQLILGPPQKNKSDSIPTIKTKSISISKLKPSNFRPVHKNESNLDARTIQVNFYTPTKTRSISIPHTQSKFRPITEMKSVPISTLVSSRFRCPDTKIELISIQTLSSPFRSPKLNQVNCDHPHNKQISFIPKMKSSQVRSPTLK